MSVMCKATVIHDGDIFTLGTHEHLHPKEREIRNEKFSFPHKDGDAENAGLENAGQ